MSGALQWLWLCRGQGIQGQEDACEPRLIMKRLQIPAWQSDIVCNISVYKHEDNVITRMLTDLFVHMYIYYICLWSLHIYPCLIKSIDMCMYIYAVL